MTIFRKMMTKRMFVRVVVALFVVVLVVGGGFVFYRMQFAPKTITAYFPTTTAVYPGDDVAVAGIKVGSIDDIKPEGSRNRVVLKVDRDVEVPVDAGAVLVATSLIAPRFIQLTPAYHGSGPTMADGAVIPQERTAVPVEWDDVKSQLMKLVDTVGPTAEDTTGSLARFIDSTGNALDGNGATLRKTLADLSQATAILSDKSGDITKVVENLRKFVTALQSATDQIATFQSKFARVTTTVANSRTDLDAALKNISTSVVDVQRFIDGNRTQLTESVQRLGTATSALVDKQSDLEQLLHVAPNEIANYQNIYRPDQGTVAGVFVANNFASPANFLCTAIQSLRNSTSEDGAKLCYDYLGPALNTVAVNYPTFGLNPTLQGAPQSKNLVYSEERLRPKPQQPPPHRVGRAKTVHEMLAPGVPQ